MSVLEVEFKFKSPGNDRIERILARLGARKISEGTLEDIYFSHPSRDFAKTDEALRIRKMNGASELTYKGPRAMLQNAKAREEITVRTEDPLAAQRIIESLGFSELLTIRKRRKSYKLAELLVELDDVDGLGEFVELEALAGSPDMPTWVVEFARTRLGLKDIEPRTYLELLIEMQSKR